MYVSRSNALAGLGEIGLDDLVATKVLLARDYASHESWRTRLDRRDIAYEVSDIHALYARLATQPLTTATIWGPRGFGRSWMVAIPFREGEAFEVRLVAHDPDDPAQKSVLDIARRMRQEP